MGLDGRHTAGSGFIESFDSRYPTRVLETLLKDRATGRNIIWADSEYEALGDGYMGDDEITVDKITGLSSGVIKPRIAKEQEHQSQRTRSHAEVFTPSWLCNRMNNDIDAVWFGRRDVFNAEAGQAWDTAPEPIAFPRARGHGWHAYVESPRLEITCSEAPFVCSRYDTVCGDTLPVEDRIGFLDRKLRVVSERTRTRKAWVKWAIAALKGSYGFEYQGDNLLRALQCARDVLRAPGRALGRRADRRGGRPGRVGCVVELLADERPHVRGADRQDGRRRPVGTLRL